MGSSIASRVSRLRGWSSTMRTFGVSDAASGSMSGRVIIDIASAIQPHAQQRKQLIGVHGLGYVVRGPGLQALLAVALHGFGRQGQDGKGAVSRVLAALAHGLVRFDL